VGGRTIGRVLEAGALSRAIRETRTRLRRHFLRFNLSLIPPMT
jgi:hypothetical protein